MSFLEELKRRNVVRVGIAYVVMGWVVVQAAGFLFESFGAPPWVLRVVVALLLLGLPVALVFSWVYELTPEGVRRERDIDRSQSITGHTGRRLNVIIIGALTVAVLLLLGERYVNSGGPQDLAAGAEPVADAAAVTDTPAAPGEPEKSIAVLPFVSMSSSEDDEFFADGLSEELLNVLAQIDGLKVAGRTSSFYYKGRNEDLREIAEALGVANILEGSVRRSGDQLRVTAQLIEADTGFHLWSETFDRPQGDIFKIQDEISERVADALQARILGAAGEPVATAPANPEAQENYLIAQAAIRQRTLPDTRRARDLYAKAAVMDPGNPRYLAGFAMAVALQYWNFRDVSPDEAIYEAGTAIDKAMALGEPSADTLAIAGLVEELRAVTASDPNAKERALANYRQAVERDPDNVYALQWLASIYLDLNRNEEARQYFERVVELDPLNTLALTGLANAYAALGRYEDAREHLYKVQTLFPDLGMTYRYLAGIEYSTGHLDRAIVWLRRATDTDPNPLELYMLMSGYVTLGWADETLAVADDIHAHNHGIDVSRLAQAMLDMDQQAVVDEATKLFAQTGEGDYAKLSAWANATLGECGATVEILERQYPSLKAEVINYLEARDAIDAVLLAYCNGKIGRPAEQSRLLTSLLASNSLSAAALESWPGLRLTKVAALAVGGRTDESRALLASFDSLDLPVSISVSPLPTSQLPVFENLAGTAEFDQYVAQERYRIAQQAKDLASGQTLENIVADVSDAGYAFTP